MKKTELIRLIDSLLFTGLQRKIIAIYNEAEVINRGVPFKYHFFAGQQSNLPPSEATVNFLFKHVEELKPAIERRQEVNYLIIRFLNSSYEPASVLRLLPPRILPKELLNSLENVTFGEGDESLILSYKKDPSYKLIKRQVVFNTME